jgi:RNA polymerase sigma factor (sigma-70 family)
MAISKRDYIEKTEKIKDKLYRMAYAYLKCKAYALDAVDEAIYKGYKNRLQIKEPEYFNTWITRIVINECLQILRKQKHEIVLAKVPEQFVSEDFDSIILKDALHKLPKDLRNIIVLRYYGGYTIVDVADILHMPQGTVATKARRALILLRIELVV